MGQWQWLREFVDLVSDLRRRSPRICCPALPVDLIAHVLQRAVEGGHWMLTPPTLLTLVHAVQQPIGRPAFAALNVEHSDADRESTTCRPTACAAGPIREELTPITAWRRPARDVGVSDGRASHPRREHGQGRPARRVGRSGRSVRAGHARARESRFSAPGRRAAAACACAKGTSSRPARRTRRVGYYDPENDQIAHGAQRATSGPCSRNREICRQTPRPSTSWATRSATSCATPPWPRRATSEYFAAGPRPRLHALQRGGGRRRAGVGASAGAGRRLRRADVRMAAPERHQHEAQRALRRRPARLPAARRGTRRARASCWAWRSGAAPDGALDDATRDKFKAFFTQWGMDPIWKTAGLSSAPGILHFPDAVASRLRRRRSRKRARASRSAQPGRVDVVGFTPQFDAVAQVVVRRPDDRSRRTRRSSSSTPRTRPSCASRSCAISRTRSTTRGSRASCWRGSRNSRPIGWRSSPRIPTTRGRCAWS